MNKRIIHVPRRFTSDEWGGTETAVLQLTKALGENGVDSTVYAPKLPVSEMQSDPFAMAGLPIRRFRASIPVWGISAERKSQLVAVGGNMISFDLVQSLLRERRVDVIHSHAQGRLGAIGRAIARAS